MDMIYIYGVYHFFAFEMCQSFLNEGYQVVGIPYSFQGKDSEQSMLVGRNANYYEWKDTNNAIQAENKETLLIISNYDQQYLSPEEYDKITKHLKEIVDKKIVSRTVLIVPTEFLSTSIQEESFTVFVQECKSIVPEASVVAVPPLYGMGQPEQDILCQLISSNRKQGMKIPNSRYEDALPSNETASFLVEKVLERQEDVILKSSVPNHYKRCIETLIENEWEWDGVLKSNLGLDISNFHTLEVPCTATLEKSLNEWTQYLKSPLLKNTFQL